MKDEFHETKEDFPDTKCFQQRAFNTHSFSSIEFQNFFLIYISQDSINISYVCFSVISVELFLVLLFLLK